MQACRTSLAPSVPESVRDPGGSARGCPAAASRSSCSRPASESDADEAWAASFLHRPTAFLLLRIAAAFATGYDQRAQPLRLRVDELRRNDCRRLRAYAADGRERLSAWLTVTAPRLCLDHFRRRFGRVRVQEQVRGRTSASRAVRRKLSDLGSPVEDLALLPDLTYRNPGEVVDERERRRRCGQHAQRAEAKRLSSCSDSVRGRRHGRSHPCWAWRHSSTCTGGLRPV